MALYDVLGDILAWHDEEIGAIAGSFQADEDVVQALGLVILGLAV